MQLLTLRALLRGLLYGADASPNCMVNQPIVGNACIVLCRLYVREHCIHHSWYAFSTEGSWFLFINKSGQYMLYS